MELTRAISDARELGCDPIFPSKSDFVKQLVNADIVLPVTAGEVVLVPMWLTKAALDFIDGEGYAGLTLGDYIVKLIGDET